MTVLDKVKPLRPISIKPEYSDLKELPVVENKAKREETLKRALRRSARIKPR